MVTNNYPENNITTLKIVHTQTHKFVVKSEVYTKRNLNFSTLFEGSHPDSLRSILIPSSYICSMSKENYSFRIPAINWLPDGQNILKQ
jgi:hypothetical protein